MVVESRKKQQPPSGPVHKPLRPPGSRVGDFLWRMEMWVWTAFPFSVLEPWEVVLLRTCSIVVFFKGAT